LLKGSPLCTLTLTMNVRAPRITLSLTPSTIVVMMSAFASPASVVRGPLLWKRIFHRATNAAGKSGRITGSSYPARFPGCICSTMENAFPQKPCGWPWAFLMVPALRVRLCARALGLWPCGFEPTTNVVFVGTSYPARFPGCSCSTMENAFPQLPIHHDTFRRAVSLSHR
jgi:hypothetical protein